jgi:hypothetical protein
MARTSYIYILYYTTDADLQMVKTLYTTVYIFKWHPGYVPYLPYPRYATDQKHGGIQLSFTCQDIYQDNLN